MENRYGVFGEVFTEVYEMHARGEHEPYGIVANKKTIKELLKGMDFDTDKIGFPDAICLMRTDLKIRFSDILEDGDFLILSRVIVK